MAEKTPQTHPGEGLGRAIAARRAELGMKRKDLSAATDLSYPYISEIENGVKVPSEKALRRIADALQVEYATLVAYGEDLRELTLESETSFGSRRVFDALPESANPLRSSQLLAAGEAPGLDSRSIRRLAASARGAATSPNLMMGVDSAQATHGGDPIDEQVVADLVSERVREEMGAWVTDILPDIVSKTVAQVIARMLESEDVPE